MTYDERVVRTSDEPTHPSDTVVSRRVTRTPSAGEILGRIVIVLFGIIQVLIILRIVLLLLDAREGNDLVSWILNTSQIFVAPFEGMLNTNALKSGRLGPRRRRGPRPVGLDAPRGADPGRGRSLPPRAVGRLTTPPPHPDDRSSLPGSAGRSISSSAGGWRVRRLHARFAHKAAPAAPPGVRSGLTGFGRP
jgi:hypothetical protein